MLISSCAKPQEAKTLVQKVNEFEQILTESTLNEWNGDDEHWRFEDGILIGETTPEKILIENSFFIWEKELVRDFELQLEYRISARGNSGINYRSQKVDGKNYVLRGYQADIDGENEYSGQLYEERGRSFLAKRGQVTHIGEENHVKEIGNVGGDNELLSAIENKEGWNKYHLIIKGNTFIHMINGRVMSITFDEGKSSKQEGLLGFQIHLGPPMRVEFRNVLFKRLTP
ncbi:MAG: DUF1080 domain-containing protein [Gracilimonas sp.]|uniref:3-keto-disaccharide hydrolase n=1 Tax=Gracilimonas sp. TaxID=1974203 RepID=UPI0019AB4A8D|nr:DUF1080 domain-containing protein [Gracilimonas sp.]MBD3615694.1 DUF1080 domain-containing protein [Gracilimonas sp.]